MRQFLLHEPSGKVTQCTNLVLPSSHPEACAGFVIMESASYPPMSGSNTICTVTALLETGMVPMVEPVTQLTLEAPGGLIRVKANCADGKCESVTFRNVPCFVFGLDRMVEVEGLGSVKVDVAYGGMIYVLVDAQALGFAIDPSEARDSCRLASASRPRRRSSFRPFIRKIRRSTPSTRHCLPDRWRPAGRAKTARNTVVVSPGRLDRSPCGTGTSARLAVMHARREIKAGETFVHKSIIDTEFRGRIDEVVDVAGTPASCRASPGAPG